MFSRETQVKLARAARTDAGVHAAGNVVSMKLINAIPGVPDLVARINEELPPEIRIWSIVRTCAILAHIAAHPPSGAGTKLVQRENVCPLPFPICVACLH